MTALTSSNFTTRFPEFGETDLSVVEASIAEAERFTPAAQWGSVRLDGIAYLAAHILSMRVMQIGQQVGVLSGSPTGELLTATLYGQEYKRLLDSLALTGFAL